MPKVAFIGAGSVNFTQELVTDIFAHPVLEDSTISLMDIDGGRLEKSAAVLDRVVEEHDLDATLESTTDRAEALRDADYVINAIHVGGREPFENEIRVPAEYGVEQAVGDTLGPGGVFRAARTIPAMLEIARDMEELCPDAPLLNYTNPMAMLCWAVDEATDIEIVGLCHSVQGTARAIAEYVDVPADELEYWVAGINHMAWFLEAEHDGEDVYPTLFDAMDDPSVYENDSVRFEVMRNFGYFVTESSHHMSEYVPYFRANEDALSDTIERSSLEGRTKWMPTGQYFQHWCDYQEDAAQKDADEYDIGIERSEEYGAQIIHSMETGERRRMNINVRNDGGIISNLPENACVEVPCLVDDRGINPCAVGDLPPQLAALNRTNINVQELAVQAALHRDETLLRQAIKLDPLTSATLSLEETDDMVDDLLAANAEHLPELSS